MILIKKEVVHVSIDGNDLTDLHEACLFLDFILNSANINDLIYRWHHQNPDGGSTQERLQKFVDFMLDRKE